MLSHNQEQSGKIQYLEKLIDDSNKAKMLLEGKNQDFERKYLQLEVEVRTVRINGVDVMSS